MIKVYFRNSYDEDKIIGHASNYRAVSKIIQDFLKEKNFKSYYTRNWEEDDKTWYDVGSHSEFFWIEGNHLNDLMKQMNKGDSQLGLSNFKRR